MTEEPNAGERDFIVRPATRGDADAIAGLCNQLAEHTGEDGVGMTGAKVAADLLPTDSGFHLVVAEREAVVVGYALYHIAYESAYAAKGHYLSDLFVEPAARRRGIASALMAAVAAGGKKAGGEYIWWDEMSNSPAAKALYAKMANICVPVMAYAVTESHFIELARRHPGP